MPPVHRGPKGLAATIPRPRSLNTRLGNRALMNGAPPAEGDPEGRNDPALEALRAAIHAAPGRIREIEVGIPLSITLGKMRPVVSCGGCSDPLQFEGIPARTNARMHEPFRLVLEGGSAPG
jgi:hypothetical protein